MQSLRMRMIAMACLCSLAISLPALAQLTITNPDEAQRPENVRQVSLSTATPPVPSINLPIAKQTHQDFQSQQLRIRVQFLEVDPATREAIYAGLGTDSLQTSTNLPKVNSQEPDLDTLDDFPTQSDAIIESAALVTQSVLNTAEVAGILKMTEASNNSIIANAPNLILLNDNKVELTDMIQRPFIVNHERQGDKFKPILQHIDEGTRLGIMARPIISDGQTIENFELGCEIVSQRVIETKTDFIFGLAARPLKVQIPYLKVTTARVAATLLPGQTLLIDPHVSSTRSFRSETSVPFLGKIPYVGQSFKNVAVTTHDQHVIVLLHPESVAAN
ncbi:type II and III secretion system protein [Rhodopirellula sp.]|nr:hypothetical protein [Rubripirellula sp.]MDB4393947.1 type II and III secretion system protein [Rhodopirellula sp.]